MTLADTIRRLLVPLVWYDYPPEVPGEQAFIANRGEHRFWVKREAHETKWTAIVTDGADDPCDLKCDIADLAAAKLWCEEWRP